MEFIGEHLLPGQLGHLFIITAFVASLISTISYFIASNKKDFSLQQSWIKLARVSFFIQVVSVLTVFGIIFYLCSNHFYEYLYVYKHASRELESKYLLACIWEGQEGSFLLWAIWHSILGSILIFKSKDWEASVMTIVSLAQVFLFLMVLGIYVSGVKIGNSPFVLTRNELQAPIFNQPNYLSFIQDGMGLNVLLRNYWMVIHPPFLFLGFASLLVPFAFAYAGIKNKLYGEWVKPALPWALFGAAILGAGIMMGGKWAYESLSFGGYWAWDPVENASLVPWLMLIAGLHTMVIYLHTGRSLKASYLFIFLAFSFVLYSTFLTRTGVLGDTSVHAFTEAGKAINVMIFLFFFLFTAGSLVLLFSNSRNIPTVHSEEDSNSREFWMFIGSIVIFLSSIFIIAITSIPTYNQIPGIKDLIIKFHGGPLAMPEDPEFVYNKIMILVAFILGIITAIAQYFKYKKTPPKYFLKKIAVPTFFAAIITALIAFVYPFTYFKQGIGFRIAIYMGFFAMVYAVVANAAYLVSVQKGKLKTAGGSVSHIGFALMIAGMIISSSNKQVISSSLVNGITFAPSKDPMTKQMDDPQENLTLIRDVPTRMNQYEVTYFGDSSGHEKGRKFYSLLFNKKNKKDGSISESFVIKPDVYVMKDNNMSSNPDTKTYLTKDVFTYISYALKDNQNEDTTSFKEIVMNVKDTAFYSNGFFVLNDVLKNPKIGKYNFGPQDAALVADITVHSKDSIKYAALPALEVDDDHLHYLDDTLYAQNLYLRFNGVTSDHKIRVGLKESDRLIDFVTVKTFVFPYINLVWLGIVIMFGGILISMINRSKMRKGVALTILIGLTACIFFLFLFANN